MWFWFFCSRIFRRTATWWSHSSVRKHRQIGDVSLLLFVDYVQWCAEDWLLSVSLCVDIVTVVVVMTNCDVWRSIQHNNTTPLLRMRFSGTSLLGKKSEICFAEYLKIVNIFSLKLSVRTGWTSDFVLKQTKRGFLGPFSFGPSKLVASATSTPTTPTTPSVINSVTL